MMRVRRLHRIMGIDLAVGLLALASLAGDAAADPPPARCDKQNAKAAFVAGIEKYGSGKCEEAIPELEEAAALCPVPPKDLWVVRVHLFGEDSYLPFFYLGNCHLNKKRNDPPRALRQFYLSSCFGEPARDKEETRELSSLTDKCRLQMKKQKPEPLFGAGYHASEQKEWKEAAEKMWDALQVREEDGKTTNSSGRWPDPYLPRFRLADALFELGCPRQACEQLDRSLLKQLTEERVKPERQRMEKLRPLCEPKRLAGQKEKEVCQQWRCWLGQGAP